MPVTTNTRKLAALLGASGAGIGTDGTLTSTAIGEVIVAGDIAAGAVDTAELATDAVTTVKIANDQVTGAKIENSPTIAANLTVAGNATITGDIVPSTPLSHRNMIINGGMQVWQRATAETTVAFTYGTADRWGHYYSVNGAWTTERYGMNDADRSTTGHSYALKLACTGTDTSIGADQYAFIRQKIEAQDCQHLLFGTANAKTVTLSFWVYSGKTGTYCVSLGKEDSTLYFCPVEYTIDTANTWEQKKITITPTMGSTSLITTTGGTIANDTGTGLVVDFALTMGTNRHGTNATWQAGEKITTSNQVNWFDSTSNRFYLTGVQLELGSNATPFEHRRYGDELARCQRYYTQVFIGIQAGKGNGSTGMGVSLSVPVSMRATPTVSLKSLSGLSRFNDSSTAVNTPTGIALSETDALNSTFYLNYSGLSGITDNRGWTLQSSDSVKFTAEL